MKPNAKDSGSATAIDRLRDELLDAQFEATLEKRSGLVMIVAGTSAAGRSEVVNKLLEWLDPKHISVHAFGPPDHDDRQRPSMWRYWQTLPARGRITIYFAGWYGECLGHPSLGKPTKSAFDREAERIRNFEKLLVRERVRILKVYLHTDARTQRLRIEQLRGDKLTRWRVTEEDLWAAKHRAAAERFAQRAIDATDHPAAPWHRVDGSNESRRLLEVGRLLRDELREGLRASVRPGKPEGMDAEDRRAAPAPATKEIAKKDYERELAGLQRRLALLVRRKRFRKHGLVLAFEGMDAAGKGGAIRRVTQALDARQYQVVPVSAPSEEERAYPHLWRFWRHVPELGSIAIYDRSWYGRVLVERVRGFTAAIDWRRGYDEIVEFERELTEHGIVVAKFWLNVSYAEQLRRFEARNEDLLKRFKVDEEDWKNRRYYGAYQAAAKEMIERTHSEAAPWTVVEADDKKHARLVVLRAACEALERVLD